MEQEGGIKGKSVRVCYVKIIECFLHMETQDTWHANYSQKSLQQLQFVCPQPSLLIVGISPDRVIWGSLNQ